MPSVLVDEATLRQNIDWNIGLIATQVGHANSAKTRARSGYYKLAIIIAASIIEALVHLLLRRKVGDEGGISTGEKETYEACQLPSGHCPPGVVLVIAKQRDEVIPIGRNPDLGRMNKACLIQGIYDEALSIKIDKVRKTRNKIHLQGVDHVDRSYTKRDLKSVSDVMQSLLILVYVTPI